MATFTGTSGLDVYYGGDDADTIDGLAGDDYLYGGSGDDIINGGDDTDYLYGQAGADTLDGGAGDDVLVGDLYQATDFDRVVDILKGGAGADRFVFEYDPPNPVGNLASYDHIVDFSQAEGDGIDIGKTGAILVWGGAVTNPNFSLAGSQAFGPTVPGAYNGVSGWTGVFTWSNAGVSYLMVDVNRNSVLDSTDFVVALDGAPTIDSYAVSAHVPLNYLGTAGADTWTGGTRGEIYYGGWGDDVVSGQGGADTLYGEDGADTLSGGTGADVLRGGAGGDNLDGGDDGDTLYGNEGNDLLHGGAGNDVIYAGNGYGSSADIGGSNTLYGDDGADTLVAAGGIDTMYGGLGDDSLEVGGPGDLLYGEDGADRLSGFSSTLDGGAGDDRLQFAGDTTMTGGAGADVFAAPLPSSDPYHLYSSTITDFDVNAGDRLSLGDPSTYGARPPVFRGALDNGAFTLQLGQVLSSNDYGPGFTQVWTWGQGADTYVITDIDGDGTLSNGDLVVKLAGVASVGVGAFDPASFVTGVYGVDGADNYTGAAASETFYGVNGDDIIHGGAGGDTLYGNKGADQIWGDGDDDTIYGGLGVDQLDGGTGSDLIFGGAGGDVIHGGDGDDQLNTGGGTGDSDDADAINQVHGDAGDDQISGSLGQHDELHGGDGADNIIGTGHLYGDDGADTLTANNGSTLDGGAGSDMVVGRYGADTLIGGTGRDWLYGGDSGDLIQGDLADATISGEAGDDIIQIAGLPSGETFGPYRNPLASGGSGNDRFVIMADLSAVPMVALSGDAGQDTLDLSHATGFVSVALMRIDAPQTGMGRFLLYGFENVTAGDYGSELSGMEGANVLTGGLGADWLYGGDGDDQLLGGGGNDHLYAGSGFDLLRGDGGFDFARYDSDVSAVIVNLATGQGGGGAFGDTYQSVEGAVGTAFNDTMTGDANANSFYGLGGDDTLSGGAGDDTLDAGDGADHLYGGLDADTLIGGAGYDFAHYDNAAAGVTVNLLTGQGSSGEATGDVLGGIEGLFGSTFGDTLTGDGGANTLYGLGGNDALAGGGGIDNLLGAAGDDTLQGDDGDDQLYGGLGADILTGGAGIDFARYDTSASAVTVNLSTGFGAGGEAAGDQLTGLEGLVGSAYNDVLTGDDGANGFYGLAGDDIIGGGLGADTLEGGDGNDHLHGGDGNDYLIGGAGYDFARYDDGPAGLIVNLATGQTVRYMFFPHTPPSILENDILIGIEGVVGSGNGDTISGNAVANALFGLGGGDTLSGAEGNDDLWGGDGDDHLYGQAGADTLHGDAGLDFARYDNAASGVVVSLATGLGTGGEAAGDVLSDIEGLYGSRFNDTLIGGANVDQLNGGAGDDHLYGGAGPDMLNGGADFDFARYDNAAAGVQVSLAPGMSSGEAMGDVLIDIEGLVGSAFGDILTGRNRYDSGDTLYGQAGNDTLSGKAGGDTLDGGAGDDHLYGGADNDYLIGGADFDFARYDDAGAAVTVSLQTGLGTAGDAAGDVLNGVEGLVGSTFGDTLTGDGGANTIFAQAGDDIVRGGGGRDLLYGGLGADRFIYTALGDSTFDAADGLFDFSLAEADRVDLSAIDANAALAGDQAFVLATAFSNQAGQAVLTYDSVNDLTKLSLDANGDSVADFALFLSGHLTTAEGFIL